LFESIKLTGRLKQEEIAKSPKKESKIEKVL